MRTTGRNSPILSICTLTLILRVVVQRGEVSGGIAMVGAHCIRHCSTTQLTISLSSCDAELHGIGMGFQHAMGLRSMYRDLGYDMKIAVRSDATAAIGIARRRGLGKLKHLDCEDLWIQSRIKSRMFKSPKTRARKIRPICKSNTWIQKSFRLHLLESMWFQKKVDRHRRQRSLFDSLKKVVFCCFLLSAVFWDHVDLGPWSPEAYNDSPL